MLNKIKDAFQVIKILAALVPLIRPLIEAFEVPGNGAEKKAAVLDTVAAVMELLPWEIEESVKETVLTVVSGLIDLIIGILNLLGHNWRGAS